MVKVVAFFKKRQDLTREQFKNYWMTKHKNLELDTLERDQVRKVVVSFTTGEVIGAKSTPYDAMVEMYFDNLADMRTQFAGKRDNIMLEDERNFIDLREPRIFVVTEENLIGEKS